MRNLNLNSNYMIEIGKDCKIDKTVQLNVEDGKIDDRTVISEGKDEGEIYTFILEKRILS